MKLPIAIGSLVIGSVLIAPKFIATQTQTKIEDLVAQATTNPAFTASIKEYHSGWFSSDAVIHVKMAIPTNIDGQPTTIDLAFDYDVALHHGPIIFSDNWQLGLISYQTQIKGDKAREAGLVWDTKLPLYSHDGLVTYNMDSQGTESIPPFSFEVDDIKGQFSGYQGQITTKGELVNYQGVADNLILNSEEQEVAKLEKLMFKLDAEVSLEEMLTAKLYSSDFAFSIDKMNMAHLVTMENFIIDGKSVVSADGKNADIKFGYHIAKIDTPEEQVSDIDIEIEMNQFSAQFYEFYQSKLATKMASLDANDPAAIAELTTLAQEGLPLLFASDPELKITKLGFTMPEGSFTSNMDMRLGSKDLTNANIQDPNFWLQNLILNAKAQADKPLAEKLAAQMVINQLSANPNLDLTPEQIAQTAKQQAPMMLSTFNQQGFITQSQDKIEMKFNMAGGNSKLNGKPFAL